MSLPSSTLHPVGAKTGTRSAKLVSLRILLLPLILLSAACQSKLQVDLAVSAPSGATAVTLAVPTVSLSQNGSAADSYDTGYGDALDLLPYSSDDDQHSDRLQLLTKDNVSGTFDGILATFDATLSYVTLSNGAQVPITLGSQPNYAALSLTLDKNSGSKNDSADVVITLELPFSLIDRRTTTTADYELVPVLRAVDKSKAGSITGTIAPSLLSATACGSAAGNGVAVYVYSGSGVTPIDYYNNGTTANAYQPLASSLLTYDASNNDYTFEIRFLPAGSYTVAWTCKAGTDQPNTSDTLNFQDNSTSVSVTAGAATPVTFD